MRPVRSPPPHLGQTGEDGRSDPLPGVEPGIQPEEGSSATLAITNLQQQQSSVLVGPANLLNLPDKHIYHLSLHLSWLVISVDYIVLLSLNSETVGEDEK